MKIHGDYSAGGHSVELQVTYEDNELLNEIINIPTDDEDEIADAYEFSDNKENEYRLDYVATKYSINYTLESTKEEDYEIVKEFLDEVSVNFNEISEFHAEFMEEAEKHYEEIENANVNDNIKDSNINSTLKFFSIKTSQEEGIKKLSDFYKSGNITDSFSFNGLTQLYNDVEIGSLVFFVSGGDKAKIKFDYTQGLYGVAKVIKAPYEKKGRSYKIDLKFIYFFNKVITQKDLYKYEDTINVPNVGITVGKGEQNQAISSIDIHQAKSIILAATKITKIPNNTLFSLFPWVKDEYKRIATKNYKSLIDTLPPALNVISIATVFAKYLMNYNSKHTTTLIGIFGMWGRGKTYFFDKVKDYIISTNNKEQTFYFCKFQPWKYQKQESAWAYLYQTILESYLKKNIEYLDDSIVRKILDFQKKLAEKYKSTAWLCNIITSVDIERNYKILLLNIKRLGVTKLVFSLLFIILTSIWIFIPFEYKLNFFSWLIGAIGLSGMIFMYKSYSFYMKSKSTAKNILDIYGKTNDYSNYLGFQSEIEKELSFLLQTYIDVNKEKLVLFIDDLDRCKEEIIIDIVDGLKLVLDNDEINSRLIVVTAIDERILEKSIRHKYFNQKMPGNVGAKEYIEKFFLMGIKLNQLNDNDIDDLVDKYTYKLNNELDENSEIAEELIDYTNYGHLDIDGEISEEIGPDGVAPLIMQSKNGDEKPFFVNNHLNINSFVLEDYEIGYIKEVLKKVGLLTPRKINMFIHRYLIFKSLVLTILDDSQYESFDSKMLVEIVIMSQKKKNLKKFRQHYITYIDYEIPIPLDDFATDKINRDEYIILIKFAEMVSPF